MVLYTFLLRLLGICAADGIGVDIGESAHAQALFVATRVTSRASPDAPAVLARAGDKTRAIELEIIVRFLNHAPALELGVFRSVGDVADIADLALT
jgi:hypothetical protein